MPKKKVTYIDLFAGLGGIRLGFSRGFEKKGIDTKCVFSSKIKEYAITVYKGYYGDEKIHGDIFRILIICLLDFLANLLVLQEQGRVFLTQEELCFLR